MSRIDDARAEGAIQALSLILREANKDKLAPEGKGILKCPVCQGSLAYTFVRTKPSRRRQSLTYTGVCTTPECITLRGH